MSLPGAESESDPASKTGLWQTVVERVSNAGRRAVNLFHLRQRPQLCAQTIMLTRLPRALDGLRIVQISDLHRSLIVLDDLIEQAIELGMRQQPDLIAVTGDFITGTADKLDTIEPLLARLDAPRGVWAVLGNHDHYSDETDLIVAGLQRAGLRVLMNEASAQDVAGERWWIVGVDDQRTEHADIQRALQDVPDDEFKLVLSHCPDYACETGRFGVDLQLSGHTHGPQIGVWPFSLLRPSCGREFVRGLYQVDDCRTQVYTNIGIGVVSLPLRINRPPEVTLLTLRRNEL